MKPLLTKTLIFSFVLGAITAILKYTDIVPAIHSQWYGIILFYFILTTFILFQFFKSLQKTIRKFISVFLSMTVLRMILFISVILLYAFLIQHNSTGNAVGFILTFSVYYLFFTTWEIILIVSILKHKNNHEKF